MNRFISWIIAIDAIVLFAFGIYMVVKKYDTHSASFNIIALIVGDSLITMFVLLDF